MAAERLQKILSQAGVASRRAGERLMLEGRVTVNGATIRELGTKADASRDDIRVDGRRVKLAGRARYLLLNKPRGFVTTRSDPQRRPTVLDLIVGIHEYVYPVGRLDFDSEGLLILTNDGELAARLTHPRHCVTRVYEAHVLGAPDAHDLNRLAKGITLDGVRTQPSGVRLKLHQPSHKGDRPRGAGEHRPPRTNERATTVLEITLREGRKRQVRKMCDAIGHPVTQLKRVAIGPIRDPRLRLGAWRELSEREVDLLRAAASH
jgi:23S rRNA pseudouridine2605 synthase